ncbi:carbamoyltransferase N-terminal domain-containing protein [Kitasatospora sp. NPDC057500]|uniref:carbamoyltransferase N-terminal domain-containing protein n=1 Tax=Kitasatospora sp. NPDC057500 TaxID=3346151 RepID=UPI00369D599A
MLICGLKLTHDGSVALLDDNRLIFSVEIEKISNNPRYSLVSDLRVVPQILQDFGFKTDDIDRFVIDGWDGRSNGVVNLQDFGRDLEILTAPYHENLASSVLSPGRTGTFTIAGGPVEYSSYFHVSAHLIGAYCTSPFARRGEPAFSLVWDGGMFPRLYWVDPRSGTIENGGPLFPLIGHIYATAGHHFGPWRRATDAATADDLSVAGKLMAYIALGDARSEVKAVLRKQFAAHFDGDGIQARSFRDEIGGWGTQFEPSVRYLHPFYRDVAKDVSALGVSDEDVLASVHEFLQELLIDRISAKIRSWKGAGPWNLTFSGGCALNIKWNSALRRNKLFADVWVPPFPNDSGAALGTAACRLVGEQGLVPLEWHARRGPEVKPSQTPSGWRSESCTPAELAAVLHETGAPVVVLNDRAELGPRALGGRSILSPASNPGMKDLLNRIKGREHYRPVAPICLVDEAPAIFDPGTPDPHMLFEHRVRPDWLDRIPAIVHLDGTARLQTVSREDDPVLEEILQAYQRLSGIPVLCNTSANLNGSGFFPDVASAMEWGGVDLVWSAGTLYRRSFV